MARETVPGLRHLVTPLERNKASQIIKVGESGIKSSCFTPMLTLYQRSIHVRGLAEAILYADVERTARQFGNVLEGFNVAV
jgi:hypothetical protein